MRTPGAYSKRRPAQERRQFAWNSMRVLRVFTTAQIVATAEISEANLRKFLPALVRSGYVRLERPKQNGKTEGHAIWRLARNTGPRAPIVRTGGDGVYDPNQDVFYPFQAGGHESP